MLYEEILQIMKSLSDPEAMEGMARSGIHPVHTYGISIPDLWKIAGQLWSSGIHGARILASLIAEPQKVSEPQLEQWVKDFDSWDVCDQCCNNLIRKTEYAWKKAIKWSERAEEFVKRAGFFSMAQLAVHDKRAADPRFEQFFLIIRREAADERDFVKKAVNWALRQIGKRNRALNKKAIRPARQIQQMDSRSARWIAEDALRELTSDRVQERFVQNR